MNKLLLLSLLLPVIVYSQENGTGIKWVEGLSWAQVKEKAKEENKYIFLDVFATWCGPCKEMDKRVYPNDTVGNFMNGKFISVKVQTDQTKKDDQFVKSWYKDAASIMEQYRIEAYPSFIFLSPQGSIVHRGSAYKGVSDFIALAIAATEPGKVYVDPYAAYKKLVAEYKQGIKYYDKMPYMITIAYKWGENDFGKQLLEEHTAYLQKLNPQNRYTKEAILMWATFVLRSEGPRFQFFYKDGDIIDEVMNEKGYAANVIDKSVLEEIIIPFFDEQNTNKSIAMSGMYVSGRGVQSDNSEADWKQLDKMICQKFNKTIASRNVLAARMEWYKRHHNTEAFVKYGLIKISKYPPTLRKAEGEMNDIAWEAFNNIKDRNILNDVIKYTEKEVKRSSGNDALFDTYANLLYKVGRKAAAIEWQQKAIDVATKQPPFVIEGLKETLRKMKAGEATYGVEPLVGSK